MSLQMRDLLEDMALNGYGVVWSNRYNEYRPFEVDKDNTIGWRYDPVGCSSEYFETAVHATHKEMLKQLGPYENSVE